MALKPVGNNIVVKLQKIKKTSASGIILTTEDKNEQSRGEIVAIGGGYGEEAALMKEFKVGDLVIFGKYSGEEIKDDSDSDIVYKVVKGKDIIAIVG